ncbi:MAG: acyltransferase [Bacteroidetes bacterium]|nr:acyltransferase [Bacteroidota bacterium]
MSALEQKRNLSYIPGLDGLRGFFCLIIIIAHWQLALPIAPFGWEGLQMFFILSGFLITRILVHEREKHNGFGSYIKAFYLKRTLRIFPLYFLFLIFWGLIRVALRENELIRLATDDLAQNWAWYFTYTSNLKSFFNVESLESPFFIHLWSLALEEQFYLVMPFMVFFLRGKWLKGVIIAFILIPFITRPLGYYFLTQKHDDVIWAGLLVYRNIFFQCDAFALGAAIAVFNLDFIKRPKVWFFSLVAVYIVLVCLNYPAFRNFLPLLLEHAHSTQQVENVSVFWYINMLGHPEILPMSNQYLYMMPLINIACFFLVLCPVQGKSIMTWLFENNLMVKIGRVTYAMYVFHFALIIFVLKVVTKILGTSQSNINAFLHIPIFIVYLVVLYYLSVFSFKYIEGPFLKLKNKIK